MFAYLIAILMVSFSVVALRSKISRKVRLGIYSMLAMLVVQISLGISTIVFHVPVATAAAHQVGAVALLTATLFVSHSLLNRN
jgi:cytochrome c oxidase assembly protein subunit 15